ncbi:MAG TPA: IPT/TIG domain-containing protein [Solirubrobacteraceae bacterium]|jgi:hypothetical protein|nr:IPT/TIG domain-containing protein [Solirubrobacteraceae bacterium]
MTDQVTGFGRAVVLRAGLLAAMLSLLVSVALAQLLASEHGASLAPSALAPHQGLSSLPAAAQGPISAAIGGDGRSYLATATSGGGFEALSSAQRLRSRFGLSGVELSTGAGTLGLSLEKIGYGPSLATVASVTPTAEANRVIYAHAQIGEWYANGPAGVEQGFTLARAPSGIHSGRLTLSLALSGSLTGALARDGRSIAFTRPGGPSLHYGALVATDSRGRTLSSSMQLEAGHLLLRIDDRGASYPLRIDPLVQNGEALTVSEADGAIGKGQLGYSVAMSADGNTALVGAPADNDLAGAVWTFVRSGGEWTRQGPKLTGGEAGGEGDGCGEKTGGGEEAEECSFGRSIALSADGKTALIGGPRQTGPCPTGECHNQGAAWVFAREGSSWTLQSTLTGGEDETIEGRFGRSVALSGDGKTAVIGAPANSGGGGAAWVFSLTGSSWERRAKLTGGAEAHGLGFFGRSVAISGDGTTALVGAPGDSGFTGAAWAFTGSSEVEWAQQGHKLVGGEEAGPEGRFGYSVALSQDGATALVGGRGDNKGAGAAWAFTRASEAWSQQGGKLTGGEEESEGGQFGYSVTLTADGNSALIGAPRDSAGIGAAWLFARSAQAWSPDGPKLAGAGKGWFGASVALGVDGKAAMIGAPIDGAKAGTVWLFHDPATIPLLTEVRPSSGPVAGGTSVTITGSRLGQTTNVQFGAAEATFTVNSESSITAIAPAHAAGRVPVIVTTPEGKSQGLLDAPEFTYVQAPGIREVSPSEGPTTGGTPVTIAGTHLGEATAVSFGSVAAPSFTVVSSNEIRAVSPAEPEGKVTVTVTTPGGAGKGHFTFVTPPGSGHDPPGGSTLGSTATGSGAVLGFGPLCSASLLSRNIAVLSHGRAAVKLIWRGSGTCTGKLTLSARVKAGKRVRTKTIATGRFSLVAGRARTIIVRLNRLGRVLLGAGHGRLRASLVIVSVTGNVSSPRKASVRLALQRTRKTSKK